MRGEAAAKSIPNDTAQATALPVHYTVRPRMIPRGVQIFVLCGTLLVSTFAATNSVFLNAIHNRRGFAARNELDLTIPPTGGLQLAAPTLLIRRIPRGGSTSTSSEGDKSAETDTKQKKTKKKKKKNTKKTKSVIDNVMKEKDSADALGAAIRDRADILRDEDPLLSSIDGSISSLGYALGASDQRIRTDGGGVEAATTSVVANYFLKSHGGAHALQCACSLLATLSGFGAIMFQKSDLGLTMLQRTMIFAMIKHVSGLLVGASLAAKAIPKIGLSQARGWMEKLVMDPVSQYVFYTALILLWTPNRQQWPSRWWASMSIVPSILVGPVLLREVISTMLVVSDILVLCSCGEDNPSSEAIKTVLKASQSVVNAAMSLLVTPSTWREADPAQRQAILAKLVGRVSLVLEVVVGFLLSVDFLFGFFELAFGRSGQRPPLMNAVKRLLCVRLFIHFLWVRRQKLRKMAVKLRGGAAEFPFRVLDILLNPLSSMGITDSTGKSKQDEMSTWKDYVRVGLGIDN